MEEGSQSPETDSVIVSREKPDIQASKKRKVGEKTVVTVKIEENERKQRSELGPPPSDCWSWRKYGQKPIKGSPYPRGYYKCSTSKGCLAKKQVERCRTDASMLIITYTSTHNHPSPTSNLTKEPKQTKIQSPDHHWPADQHDQEEEEEEEEEQVVVEEEQQQRPRPLEMTTNYNINAEGESSTHHDNNGFHYCQSPIRATHQGIIISPEDEMINPFSTENHHHHLLLDIEEPISSYPHRDHLMSLSSVLKSSSAASSDQDQGNDFYDELEELPMSSSSFTSFMRTNFFEERILV